jgi:hypothetical protein
LLDYGWLTLNTTAFKHHQRRQLFGRPAKVLVIVLAVLLLGATGFYRASQQVPDFYVEALDTTPQQQQAAGYQLEQDVLDLHHDLQQRQSWEAVFSEEEVNGWLAADLPRKFPEFLPPGIEDPRVHLEDGQVRLACRYQSGGMATIVHLTVVVQMSDEPNTLAIRLSKARAGALPLPLKSFLEQIGGVARRLSLPLRWTQVSSDPVALLTLPSTFKSFENRDVEFKVVEVLDGQIRLAGHARDQTR